MNININKIKELVKDTTDSLKKMNEVVRKTIEAGVDKIHDFDGDNTTMKDVKEAFNKLTPEEKTIFTTGTVVTGGALPLVSLGVEETVEVGKKAVKGVEHGVKKVNNEVIDTAQKMNNVLKTAAEAIADKIHDFDGDNISLKDVKEAIKKLTPAEAAAITAGTIFTGGMLPVASLAVEGAVEVGKKIGQVNQQKIEKVEKFLKEHSKELATDLALIGISATILGVPGAAVATGAITGAELGKVVFENKK